MSDDHKRDPHKRPPLRSNTDFDPKPEEASRHNVAPRGSLSAVPVFTPGGPGMSARRVSHHQTRSGGDAQTEEKAKTKGPPTVEKGQEGEQRAFRKFGSRDAPKREQGASEPSKGQGDGKKPFRGFGRGDLSRDFNDRSR